MKSKSRTARPKILQTVLESVRPRFDSPLTVRGSFLFLSDFEIPFHDAAFINACFTVARAYGVRQCVWGGDAMHFEAFSPFPGADTDAEQELSEIDEYLPGFLEPFDKITWFMGNHDDRPQRALDRKISNQKALRLAIAPETQELFRAKVTMSEYYWCLAAHGWQLEHQKNNSTIPARVAQQLTMKYHCHVITGHTHKVGATKQNGFWAIDAGCGVDVKRLAYPNLRHSTHTAMENGAVLMLEFGEQYVPLPLVPERMEFELWRARKA
jgi:predicted phosphodiesterase